MSMKEQETNNVKELSHQEMTRVGGGVAIPRVLLAVNQPTWYYVDGTPQWAIDNARNAGYEVEKLD
jgi:hypothetical protein